METITGWLHVTPEELARRGLTAGLILVVAIVLAGAASRLGARWGRRVGGRPDGGGDLLARGISRHVSAIVILGGVYYAVEALEIGGRWEKLVHAITFVIGTFVAVRLGIRVVEALARSYFERRAGEAAEDRAEREYLPLTNTVATVALVLVGIIAVANHFGHNVASLIAALGVGSLAIGLAAQQTLGNMIAGFTLLVDRPFRPGDRIKIVSGETGEVLEIGLRSTRILMPDKHLLVVPNTELANSRVVNLDLPTSHGRAEVRVKLPLHSDVAAWSERLRAAAERQEGVASAPAPAVRVIALDEVRLELALQFQLADQAAVAEAEDAVRREVLGEVAAAWPHPPPASAVPPPRA